MAKDDSLVFDERKVFPSVSGEDFLLGNPKLKRRDPVHTLAYTELLSIGRDHFFDLLSNFPDQIPEVRRFILRCVFKGGFRADGPRRAELTTLHRERERDDDS